MIIPEARALPPPQLKHWDSWTEYHDQHIDEHETPYDLVKLHGGTIPQDTEIVYFRPGHLVNVWADMSDRTEAFLLGRNGITNSTYLLNRPKLMEKYHALLRSPDDEQTKYQVAANLLADSKYIQEIDEVLLFMSAGDSHYVVWAGHSDDLIIRVDARKISFHNLRDIYMEWFQNNTAITSHWEFRKGHIPAFTPIPKLPRFIRTKTV